MILFKSLIVGKSWLGFELEWGEGQDEDEEDADIVQAEYFLIVLNRSKGGSIKSMMV